MGQPTDVLSLAKAKAYCKIDYPDDDDLITALIAAAVTTVENYTEYRLYQRPEIIYMTNNFYGYEAFQFPINAASVVSQDSMNTNVYTVQFQYQTLRTLLFWGQGFLYYDNWVEFFTNYTYKISVKPQTFILTLDVGYTDPPNMCPQSLITAVKQLVVYYYDNRDLDGFIMPSNVGLMLNPYRRFATIA